MTKEKVDRPADKKQTPEKCDHAWVISNYLKVHVCLWCGVTKAKSKHA